MKQTLVIGAAGFVGKYLTKELESNGHRVYAADIPELNILDVDSLEKKFSEATFDYVVNLAAISSVGASWKDPIATLEVNVRGTLNILNAVQKHCPKGKVLLVGSAEEYAPKDSPLNEDDKLEASNPYGITKVAQENFAELYRKKYGMNIVCTRSFNHTGVGQTTNFVLPCFVKQIADIEKSGKPGKIFVGNLAVSRDFSDVRDVVTTYRKLLENDTEYTVYNVGSGKANKLSDLLDYIISLASVPVEVCIDPEKFRPVDLPYLCADNSRIKDFWPGTDIRQTIKEMFENELT